jgi:F0F1-type ATP synthase membrane subunit b/b'
MKSLSKIIKGSALRLTHPKIVELSTIGLLESPALDQLEKDEQQLQDLQRESQKVLQETEAMIVDLLEKAREEARNIIAAARDEAELVQLTHPKIVELSTIQLQDLQRESQKVLQAKP